MKLVILLAFIALVAGEAEFEDGIFQEISEVLDTNSSISAANCQANCGLSSQTRS